MVYESDISSLLSEWKKMLKDKAIEPSYKDAIRDCIYDLNCLIDNNFSQEALAQEAFEQQMKEDWDCWQGYFNNLTSDGVCA